MPTLGLCSWSLHPANASDLIQRVKATGISAVQLALTPIAEQQPGWDEHETLSALNAAGITVLSGMLATVGEDYTTLNTIRETGGVRPDKHWPANLTRATLVADLAHRMNLRLVTFHAGFLPHDRKDPLYPVMIDRLRQIGSVFSQAGRQRRVRDRSGSRPHPCRGHARTRHRKHGRQLRSRQHDPLWHGRPHPVPQASRTVGEAGPRQGRKPDQVARHMGK